MKKARTESTRRAVDLPPDLLERVFAARDDATRAAQRGEREAAEAGYQHAFELLPEPRHQWETSRIMALDLVAFYFDEGRYDRALQWLDMADLAAEGLQNASNLVWYGKIKLEQGETEEAFSTFDEVFGAWKARPFRGHPPKYLAFYESRKKQKL